MSEEAMVPVGVYVLPSQSGQPPRALLMNGDMEPEPGDTVQGVLVTWQADSGSWMFPDGMPVPPDLASEITEHAKSLGVPGWD